VATNGSVDHNTILEAPCPPGTQVIGGGGNSHGDNVSLDFTGPMRGGSPWNTGDPQPDGWGTSWWEEPDHSPSGEISMFAYAICAS
jgi:hypothetical protein